MRSTMYSGLPEVDRFSEGDLRNYTSRRRGVFCGRCGEAASLRRPAMTPWCSATSKSRGPRLQRFARAPQFSRAERELYDNARKRAPRSSHRTLHTSLITVCECATVRPGSNCRAGWVWLTGLPTTGRACAGATRSSLTDQPIFRVKIIGGEYKSKVGAHASNCRP